MPARSGVLITGGSGYLGHELARQLLACGCQRICIYSRNEYNQARMRAEFKDDERLRWFIGDIRDQDRLTRAMQGVEIVIHAAALKRIEVLEYNVLEAVATNVLGTERVVKACIDAGVSKAVLISSDKAVEPLNAYGLTKALAERIFLSAHIYAGFNGPKFAVCRYGNVAGSTGSVIPTWRAQLEEGQIVQMTDPNCTRFFMTVQQAVAFVLETLNTMQGGELKVPTLPAYRLEDLAVAMACKVEVVGLRPGEKLHESMALGATSAQARRMSVTELREALSCV